MCAFERSEKGMEFYMEYRYKPSDMVCSQEMIIELDGDIIKKVTIIGGCAEIH